MISIFVNSLPLPYIAAFLTQTVPLSDATVRFEVSIAVFSLYFLPLSIVSVVCVRDWEDVVYVHVCG